MNFEFSAEQLQLRDTARRFLADKCPPAAARAVLDGKVDHDAALWQGLAEMGFLGVTIPEAYGGLGLGHLELCVLAEEMGRTLAPVPFSSSVYLATELLLSAGSETQKQHWLPRLASGSAIGTLAHAEATGAVSNGSLTTHLEHGRLYGQKLPVPDGEIADFAVVTAQEGDDLSLFLLDLSGAGVTREAVSTIDPSRRHARIAFSGASAEPLGERGNAIAQISAVQDRAAVLFAFEQLGGADRALEMARDYALERKAFGRQIGSFQAIKHLLANMYVAATLARSNCYYGAWALSTEAPELPVAAASARISATQAYQLCAKDAIEVHGGMGFTWEFDCHLHYRRSNLLALALGSLSLWEDRLIDALRQSQAA